MAGGAQHWTTEWRRFAYMRRITSGVFYMLRTDCAWAPVVFPPRVRRLDGISVGIHAQLRELVRLHAGSDPTPQRPPSLTHTPSIPFKCVIM